MTDMETELDLPIRPRRKRLRAVACGVVVGLIFWWLAR